MKYFDHHTHSAKKNSLCSCTLEKFKKTDELLEGQKLSLQFHPWDLSEKYEGLPKDFVEAANSEKIFAIGEIGLDRLKGPSLEVQKVYFEELLNLANELKKPVILHVVRCADEVLKMIEKYPDLPKIWHGFRGKKELFERIVKADIFVSLHHAMLENEDFTEYIKTHREYCSHVGFETDDKDIDIEQIYRDFEVKINE